MNCSGMRVEESVRQGVGKVLPIKGDGMHGQQNWQHDMEILSNLKLINDYFHLQA